MIILEILGYLVFVAILTIGWMNYRHEREHIFHPGCPWCVRDEARIQFLSNLYDPEGEIWSDALNIRDTKPSTDPAVIAWGAGVNTQPDSNVTSS